MAKKSKTNGAVLVKDVSAAMPEAAATMVTELREPDTAQAIATLQATILEDIDALIRMVDDSHAKLVRPFKRAAEEKLRSLGWAVLDAKTAAHMQTLNGGRAAQKAEREAAKAEAAIAKLQDRAEKARAAAQAKLQAAQAQLASLKSKANGAAPA